MLSEDGRCKTFDTRANGYVRAEGVGGVMLSHLIAEEAKLLYQVVMQDGKSASLTAPSGAAQSSLLTRARSSLERGVSCSFESHGTGTPLGNPWAQTCARACHSPTHHPLPSPPWPSARTHTQTHPSNIFKVIPSK
jgi:acyl transferase domain-containing protein